MMVIYRQNCLQCVVTMSNSAMGKKDKGQCLVTNLIATEAEKDAEE